MKAFSTNRAKKSRGQTMVEFALVLPMLLVTMYGVMEFGRLLFIYVTTTSASREAARYASGVELENRSGVLVERYRDCVGIREAAKETGLLAGITDADIDIRYDLGPSDTRTWDQLPQCPNYATLGHRVKVRVTGHFEPIAPLVPWSEAILAQLENIRSETARTIIRNVDLGPGFEPPPSDIGTTPPFLRFTSYSSWVNENEHNDSGDPYIATVVVVDSDNVATPHTADITFHYTISGEAIPGVDHTLTSGSMTIPAGETSIDIEFLIVDDTLYEYLERVVIILSGDVSLRQPWAHVVYIQDNDSPPPVYFLHANSILYEYSDTHSITVELGPTAQAASVGFRVAGTATRGNDYEVSPNPDTDRLVFPLTGSSFDEVNRWADIDITPILDVLTEGTETIVLELINPFNATLGANSFHTIELRDHYCEVAGTNPVLAGNRVFSWDLQNSGYYDTNLTRLTVSFSAQEVTKFSEVYLGSQTLWNQIVDGNSVSVPFNGSWPAGGSPLINAGNTSRLAIGFDKAFVTGITRVDAFFDNGCPPISVSNVLP